MSKKIELAEVNAVFSTRYFSLIKKLQYLSGLWPYDFSAYKYFFRISTVMCCIILLIPMINGMRIWCGVKLEICCNNFMGCSYTLAFLVKYYTAISNEEKLKKIYHRISKNWLNTNDPNEQKILEKYAREGRLKIRLYLGYIFMASFGFSMLPMIPIVLDVILPLNETRTRFLFVKAEYTFDPDEHYYKIYFIYFYTTILSSIAIICIDCTYTVIVQQICGIFTIVKYRIHFATMSSDSKNDKSYDIITEAIRLHQDDLDFIGYIEATYKYYFLVVIFLSVIFLSTGFLVVLENSNQKVDVLRTLFVYAGVLIHLFYITFTGQTIINHSNELYVASYACEWYNMPERSKKLLKIFMLRCTKSCRFTAGGLYIMNFENFGKIMKSVVSYITVILSFRQ